MKTLPIVMGALSVALGVQAQGYFNGQTGGTLVFTPDAPALVWRQYPGASFSYRYNGSNHVFAGIGFAPGPANPDFGSLSSEQIAALELGPEPGKAQFQVAVYIGAKGETDMERFFRALPPFSPTNAPFSTLEPGYVSNIDIGHRVTQGVIDGTPVTFQPGDEISAQVRAWVSCPGTPDYYSYEEFVQNIGRSGQRGYVGYSPIIQTKAGTYMEPGNFAPHGGTPLTDIWFLRPLGFSFGWTALTVSTEGGGAVAKVPDEPFYAPGSTNTLTVTAVPNSGWGFAGWSGDTNGTLNPMTIVLTTNKFITAHFTNSGSGCTVTPSGLVSWWPGASNANDTIGNNHGALDGAAGFAPGKIGQAFSFDGVLSDVLILADPSLKFTTDFTLEAWINPSDVDNYRQIFSWMGIAPDQSYQLGLAPNGALRMDVSADGIAYDYVASANGVLTANTWAHVAGTFQSGVMKLYVNGVEVASKGSTVTSIYTGTRFAMYIGTTPLGIQRFTGLIDEVCAYNRALSATEIQSLHDAGSAGKCVAPVYITDVNRSGNNLNLTWLAQSNWTYRVQYKTNLNTASPWTDVSGDVTATGNSASKIDVLPTDATQRYYRVELFR